MLTSLWASLCSQVSRKDENGRLKPMFVQFILDQVWAVHKAVLLEPDEEQARKIVNALKLQVGVFSRAQRQSQILRGFQRASV